MSKKLFLLPTLLLGAFLLFTPSCTETDLCKDLEGKCGNGQCFDGECVCDVGYEKDASGICTIKTIDKITGSYAVTEDCSLSAPASYVAAITANGSDKVNITNVWGLFQNVVTATIDSPTKLTIARQEPDRDKFFVQGTGEVTVNASGKTVITWSYTVTDENKAAIVTDNCTNTVFVKN